MSKAKYEPIRECALCHRNGNGDPLDLHHVFGGANRKLSTRYGAVVYLCHNRCHENGPEAVHRNARVNRSLQAEWQERLMVENGWTVEDFRLVFGKSYLDSEPGGEEGFPREPSEAGRVGEGRAPERVRPRVYAGANDTEVVRTL